MNDTLYNHPEVKSRLKLKKKRGPIGTFWQVDEPKVQLMHTFDHPVVICQLGEVSARNMFTENCIICGKPAEVWTCHIKKDIETVCAGWCNSDLHHSEDYTKMSGAACFGEWKPEHGLKTKI